MSFVLLAWSDIDSVNDKNVRMYVSMHSAIKTEYQLINVCSVDHWHIRITWYKSYNHISHPKHRRILWFRLLIIHYQLSLDIMWYEIMEQLHSNYLFLGSFPNLLNVKVVARLCLDWLLMDKDGEASSSGKNIFYLIVYLNPSEFIWISHFEGCMEIIRNIESALQNCQNGI